MTQSETLGVSADQETQDALLTRLVRDGEEALQALRSLDPHADAAAVRDAAQKVSLSCRSAASEFAALGIEKASLAPDVTASLHALHGASVDALRARAGMDPAIDGHLALVEGRVAQLLS